MFYRNCVYIFLLLTKLSKQRRTDTPADKGPNGFLEYRKRITIVLEGPGQGHTGLVLFIIIIIFFSSAFY